MAQNKDCEFLFTSDEEIGLIGANNLGVEITAPYMLNLDSETEGEICIGCAGGIDIFATINQKEIIQNIYGYELYEISISKLPGGHSGVEIHKNIPNALKNCSHKRSPTAKVWYWISMVGRESTRFL